LDLFFIQAVKLHNIIEMSIKHMTPDSDN